MIVFHDQKIFSSNFIITSVYFGHYVSTKIFVEYLFWEYLCFSFYLFWRQKQSLEVFCKIVVLKILQISQKKHLRWSLFVNKHLWMIASVANTINSQNLMIIRLENLKFYFAAICAATCNLVKSGLNHRCFCFLKACCKWANEQNPHCFKKMQWNKVASSSFTKCKLHCRCLMSEYSEILILACRKIYSAFYLILHEICSNSCGFPLMYLGF